MMSDRRHRAIIAALAVVVALAALMLVYLVAAGLRDVAPFGAVHDGLLGAGEALDTVLGLDALHRDFVWRALATGVFVGIAAPLIGTFLVHREMALIGETLAHTAFAGVAVGLLLASVVGRSVVGGWGPVMLASAMAVAIAGALGVEWMTRRTRTFGDVPIAVVLTGSFAVGTIAISAGDGLAAVSIDALLFGNIVWVRPAGAALMAGLAVAVTAIVAVTYKPLTYITFDERAARVARVNVDAYNTLLIVVTAVVVVGAMQLLGVILVAAMLVVPVAAATQVARSFRETLYLSVVLGEASVLAGFALALAFGWPPGGAIVVVAIAAYLLTLLWPGSSPVAVSTH